MDKEFLKKSCGHYLLYGSEFITGVGVDLGLSHAQMKLQGVPAIVTVDMPVRELNDNDQLREIFENIIRDNPAVGEFDYAFSVKSNVHKSCIVRIEQVDPETIADPLMSWG